jgi:hypothetical protein
MDDDERNNKIILLPILKKTLNQLEQLRKVLHFKNYDDLINWLINKAKFIPNSIYGVDKERLKPFSERDRMGFRNY